MEMAPALLAFVRILSVTMGCPHKAPALTSLDGLIVVNLNKMLNNQVVELIFVIFFYIDYSIEIVAVINFTEQHMITGRFITYLLSFWNARVTLPYKANQVTDTLIPWIWLW